MPQPRIGTEVVRPSVAAATTTGDGLIWVTLEEGRRLTGPKKEAKATQCKTVLLDFSRMTPLRVFSYSCTFSSRLSQVPKRTPAVVGLASEAGRPSAGTTTEGGALAQLGWPPVMNSLYARFPQLCGHNRQSSPRMQERETHGEGTGASE